MKFHHLKIENINSLYGIQEIHFDRDLSAAPLFLIMGPTGAGTTTILDGICLALFGTTPRQRHVGGVTDVAEKILSRGEGFGRVTLHFSRLAMEENSRRIHYRAEWHCWRAREKPDGNIQAPRRSLERLGDDDWIPLASDQRQKFYEEEFNNALAGMTLDDFLRSVLLAQGEFTAFLEAKEDQKADILEKLTDSHQYKQIGFRAMLRRKKASAIVKGLQERIGDVKLRSDEEFLALQNELQTQKLAQKETVQKVDAARKRLHWVEELLRLQKQKHESALGLQSACQERQERQEDYRRLESARRARIPGQSLKDRDGVDADLHNLKARAAELKDKIAALQKEAAASNESLQNAETLHKEARNAEEETRPSIQQARSKRQELQAAEESLEKAAALKTKTAHELKNTLNEKSAAEALLETAGAETDKAQKVLDELQPFHSLPEAFSGLESRLENLLREETNLEKERSVLKKIQKNIAALTEAINDQEKERTQLKAALQPLKDAEEEAQKDLENLLEDLTPAAFRKSLQNTRDQAQDAIREAQQTDEKLKRLQVESQHFTTLKGEIQDLRKKRDSTQSALDAVKEKLALATDTLQDKSRITELLKERLHLSRERENLQSGAPCPVCGSPEHPFAGQEDQAFQTEFDEADAARQKLQDDLDQLQHEQTSQKETCLKLTTALELKEEEQALLARTTAELQTNLNGCWNALFDAPLPLSEETSPGAGDFAPLRAALQTRITSEEEKKTSIEIRTATLDKAESALQSARTAALEKETQFKDLLANLNLKNQTREDQKARQADEKSRIQSLEEELLQDRSDLAEAFEKKGFPLAEPSTKSLQETLEKARETSAKLDQAQKALQKLQDRFADVEKKVTALEVLLPAQQEGRDEALEAFKQAEEKKAALEKTCAELLDGRLPDEVENSLRAALTATEEAQENARAAHQQIADTLNKKTTLAASTEDEIKTKQNKRDEIQEELLRTLQEADFADEDALRGALLPEEELRSLEKDLNLLDEKHTKAQTTDQNAESTLNAHLQKRSDFFSTDEELPPTESLQADLTTLEEEERDQNRQVGALENGIKEEQDRRNQFEMLNVELQDARKDFQRWEVLHKLIGVNHGQSFKNFAQALNLEQIVHHANHHLKSLRDRYRLTVKRDEHNHPILSFAILDRHQSNATRELSTLSGGETFLVSLALALALADFRQVRLPVETLLLDEGFGTLDQEALHEAIKVLTSLQAEQHRQVGLISHVESLREQIEHRVVVEKLSGGRSRIR